MFQTSEYQIDLVVNQPIERLTVDVNFDMDLFKRKPVKNFKPIEDRIQEEWLKRKQNVSLLFNATKFRLHSFAFSDVACSLTLNLGLTDYKDFIGTHLTANIVDEIKSQLSPGDLLGDYLARPLGCSSLLLTANNEFLLIRRSDKCAEYPLYYDVPGGYAEPDLSGLVDADKIKNEILYESIVREIGEELNFDFSGQVTLLGFISNTEKYNKPNIQFLIQ
jgi:hypothetical protein